MSTPTAPVPAVSARAIRKSYGNNEVLCGIDLEVDAGQVQVIVGPSGSGKSTFLRCINHLERIDSGRLYVEGDLVGYREHRGRLHELRPQEVARQRARTGMVFQHFNLFAHMTVTQNIVEAPRHLRGLTKRDAVELAHGLLQQVGLGDKANAYPAELSGGQQQRVAIARALAMEPRLMLFDEPTSALDPELVGDVLDVMRGLAEGGMTMVVVTHEMAFARDVGDALVVMADGQVIEQGPPRDVLANPATERAAKFLARVH
ncbi:amino acid ABC transporter ATP-binding protein [Nocardioides sp. LHD-245]|uniref:amino acid ABC transporter ATP-binding protein n=1 Tax=Nocardioides sp. LHD-245 TaxID=3051387 RepID=UPI0027E0A98F|nr:amino acid ABC transporter ATP-binding protein [Nocardioides sp. LHD-245]